LRAVPLVFGVFVATDAFGEVGACHEEHNQQQCSYHAPVDDADARPDREEVEAHPDSLFGHVVGVSAHIPAVVFLAFPEFKFVGAFSGEVERQAQSTEGGERCHHHETRVHLTVCGDNPAIDEGEDAPHLINLAVVAGEFAHDETKQGAARRDDYYGFEHRQLFGLESRSDINMKGRAYNQ